MTHWYTWRVSSPVKRTWVEFVGSALMKALIDSFMMNAHKHFQRSIAISNLVSKQEFEKCNEIQHGAWYNQHIVAHSPNPHPIKLLAVQRGNILYVVVSQWWELNMCDVCLAGLLMVKRPSLRSPVTIECCNLLCSTRKPSLTWAAEWCFAADCRKQRGITLW